MYLLSLFHTSLNICASPKIKRAKRKESENKLEKQMMAMKKELDFLRSRFTKSKDVLHFASPHSPHSSKNSGIRPIFGQYVESMSGTRIIQDRLTQDEERIRIPERFFPNSREKINLRSYEDRLFPKFRSNHSRLS